VPTLLGVSVKNAFVPTVNIDEDGVFAMVRSGAVTVRLTAFDGALGGASLLKTAFA
jgi:hypothetical protein